MRGPSVDLKVGDVLDEPKETAMRWCERGIATPVRGRPRKKAVADAGERAEGDEV